ncbi:MAG: sulfurtransferase, partial [Desulfobacula sp.]|nr:sulfurtransferase [Desulfobacula sp.]
KQTKNPKVKELFAKLSEIEVKHQMSIYTAYNDASTDELSINEFEKMVEIKALEGGLNTEEYLELFGSDLDLEKDVIALAMSIEAQALDLYERLSLTITNRPSRDIVIKIASEEKAHLASLGILMDTL